MGGDSKEHIGAAELGRLLEECRAHPESQINARELHSHLASCMSCGEQFEGLALLERQLISGGQPQSTVSHSDCPGLEFWREVAAGLTPSEEVLGRIEHASRCGYCGPLLHQAVAELIALNGEMTEEERKHVAILESTRAEWQRNLAQRITAASSSKTQPPSWWRRQFTIPRLALAGACVLAMVGVTSWVLVERNQPATAERFLAQAYTEKRTLELRMAGADYAPVRVSRGATASFTSRPEPLLKAEALIAGKLEANPSDPAWLQAEAKADILEGKYDVAVEALHRALELTPHSPDLLIDLATAHFQRALEGERKDDFDTAYEYLSQALTFRPDDPVALFNRAVVAEHQFLYQQELEDWDHYLRVDSSSQWADEARSRAEAVRLKLKQHISNAAPLLTPGELAARMASANLASEVDERIEEYLHEAIRSWLPEAYPEGGDRESRTDAKASAAQALFFLADLTSERHGDRWLVDFLSHSSAPHFAQAAAALAHSAKDNDSAEYDLARQQADVAERLFRAAGNNAGVFRAQFERIFAAQLTRHSDACRRQAARALKASEGFSYPWVQIQLALENGVCSAIMDDVGGYDRATHDAMVSAQKSGYGALFLRALGFAAEIQFDSGNHAGGSKLINAGLARYWAGQYPIMRGYNLYTEVAHKAELTGQSNLAMAAWCEAVTLVDFQEDALLSAWGHRSLAIAAVVAHQPQVAERQYAEATRLFMLAPQSDASRNYPLESEISIAQLEARLGRIDAAIARLTAVQNRIRSLSNNYLLQMFYSTLGELELGRQRNSEAELVLRPAMALAEQNLATITSEEKRTQWSKNAAPVYLALSEAELLQGRYQDALETYEFYLSASHRESNAFASTQSRYESKVNLLSVDLARTGSTANPRSRTNPTPLGSRLPLLTKETVLAYAALPHGLAIWFYDDRGLKTQWIPNPTDELQDLSERFQNLSSDPKSELSAVRRDARSLYAALIAPIENDLAPGRTLVIEAEGWLARVPFEALLDSGGRYLVERGPVLHSLGENSQTTLSSDTRISAESKALVVGSAASSQAEGLIPLPDVVAEAESVAGGFYSAHILKGREATLNSVRSELKNAQVFHFAGHALATPDGTGLLLEDEPGHSNRPRLMDAAVVRQLHLQNLQLAVLSACSTGSDTTGSNGFNSITDALVRAGVLHVVASRWAVDSGASRRFIEDFYSNLLSGEPVSEAIRSTSLRVLANPQTSHPYYWSAFAAYGER